MRHVGSGAAPKQSIGHQKPVNKFHFQDNSCCQYLLHAFEIRGARIAFDSQFSVLCGLLFSSKRCRTVVETPAPICSLVFLPLHAHIHVEACLRGCIAQVTPPLCYLMIVIHIIFTHWHDCLSPSIALLLQFSLARPKVVYHEISPCLRQRCGCRYHGKPWNASMLEKLLPPSK